MKNRKYIIELISKVKSLDNAQLEDLFEAFFTPQELDVLEMRYRLIEELISGTTQREIAKKLNISISQITRGSRELKYGVGKKIFPKLFNKNPNVLSQIINDKIKQNQNSKIIIPDHINFEKLPKITSFYESLTNKSKGFKIIAEIKTKSPSAGIITKNDPMLIANEYITGEVDAISVLTDKKYFAGDMRTMKKIANKTKIPLLCKDFILDKKQIYEARLSGASAILLIVKILKDPNIISELSNFAAQLGMDSLIEINNESELNIALSTNPKIIGVNSRNLDSFVVDKNTFQVLFLKIPDNIVKIALSGISSAEDISIIKNTCGAALIGTSLCSLPLDKISLKIKELRG